MDFINKIDNNEYKISLSTISFALKNYINNRGVIHVSFIDVAQFCATSVYFRMFRKLLHVINGQRLKC